MKRLKFDEEIGSLVDNEGLTYQGKRIRIISGHSLCHYSHHEAELFAITDLEKTARKNGADAYEVISSSIRDSRQEYDTTPYQATVTAILYKKS